MIIVWWIIFVLTLIGFIASKTKVYGVCLGLVIMALSYYYIESPSILERQLYLKASHQIHKTP